MNVIRHQDAAYADFIQSLDRKAIPSVDLYDTVAGIIDAVKQRKNAALFEYTKKFDALSLTKETLFVTEQEFAEAESLVEDSVKEAIAASKKNVHAFAQQSMRKDWHSTNTEGAEVGERFVPYSRIGVYIPGGKAPLVSTALMTAAIGQAVGVTDILAATPAGPDGKVNPALLYALRESGATQVIKVGGAQAIAAMALGTETVQPVEKIFGPGNRFVVEAKRQLVGAVSIDLLPGPSEVLIIADDSATPAFVAADLLAQAEHGGDSIVGFATTSVELLAKVEIEIERQIQSLSRSNYIREVLDQGTFALIVPSIDEAIFICNAFAPEHLSLIVKNDAQWLDKVLTAGAIYVGDFSAVAVGDFLAGPSHTLPTGGSGKSFSGIRADQFQRRTSIVRMNQEAIQRSEKHVAEFARVEGLDAHGASVSIRANFPT